MSKVSNQKFVNLGQGRGGYDPSYPESESSWQVPAWAPRYPFQDPYTPKWPYPLVSDMDPRFSGPYRSRPQSRYRQFSQRGKNKVRVSLKYK